MNAKQRRLVRRAVNAYEAANLADLYGDPEAPATRPRVSRAAAALHDRAPHKLTQRGGRMRFYRAPVNDRRQVAAYGLRCACGRKAHSVSDKPVCKVCDDRVPF